jgi:shikimate kinase
VPGVTLVAGPPCSGKTTWVDEHAGHDDIILDWDVVYAAVSRLPMYHRAPEWNHQLEMTFRAWESRIPKRHPHQAAWIIRAAPRSLHRRIYRHQLGATSVVLATPADVCLARLEADERRPAELKTTQRDAIRHWWREYEPSASDVVVRPVDMSSIP